jgi:hypothetical protein
MLQVLPVHDALARHSRLALSGWQGARTFPLEMLLLIFLGAGAAVLTEVLEFKLRLPGHAILRSVPPLALGLALAPRIGSGTVMGLGALVTSLAMRSLGVEKGLGSLVSVSLIGPLIDLALIQAKSGWRVYLGIMLAAILANLCAFAVQYAAKKAGLSPGSGMGGGMGNGMGGGMGGGGGRGRAFHEWLAIAIYSYPIWGFLAGTASAALFFHWRERKPK